ncbi:MAG: universal stress protein [Dehalococcoidia bacterium]
MAIALDDATSERALPVVERMAAESGGGELVLVAVGERAAETSRHREAAAEQMGQRLSALALRVQTVPVRTHVALDGDPARGIVEAAGEEQVDRIVMAREQHGRWETLLGAVEPVSEDVAAAVSAGVRGGRAGDGQRGRLMAPPAMYELPAESGLRCDQERRLAGGALPRQAGRGQAVFGAVRGKLVSGRRATLPVAVGWARFPPSQCPRNTEVKRDRDRATGLPRASGRWAVRMVARRAVHDEARQGGR